MTVAFRGTAVIVETQMIVPHVVSVGMGVVTVVVMPVVTPVVAPYVTVIVNPYFQLISIYFLS